jgi:hypothetical protein
MVGVGFTVWVAGGVGVGSGVFVFPGVRVAAGWIKARTNVASGALVGLAQPNRKIAVNVRINPQCKPDILFLGNMPIIFFYF